MQETISWTCVFSKKKDDTLVPTNVEKWFEVKKIKHSSDIRNTSIF
jgi:hypothetical protein